MTFNDPNRGSTSRGASAMSDGNNTSAWAIAAVIALLIVGGFMFYNSGGHGPDQTASTNAPVTTTVPTSPSTATKAPPATPAPPNNAVK